MEEEERKEKEIELITFIVRDRTGGDATKKAMQRHGIHPKRIYPIIKTDDLVAAIADCPQRDVETRAIKEWMIEHDALPHPNGTLLYYTFY